jgi:hypothetical protein
MDLLADKAGDRLIAIGIILNLFSDEALNLIARIRAAVYKRRHLIA